MKHHPIVVLFIFLVLGNSQGYGQNFFTSFDQTKIAYSDEGKGKPILLIHGFINTHKNWNNTKLKQELLNNGYRVIAPSLRGNGDSDKPQNEKAYADHAEIKDLKFLISHLGIESYEALGYSRGAILLAQLLIEDTRITKAVIGGMGKDFTNPNWERRIMFMNAFLGLEPLNSKTEGAANYAKSQNADLKALGYSQKFQPAAKIEELENVMTTILVIAGASDKDNGEPAELAAIFPNATLKYVPGVHNTTHMSKAFAKEVINFLLTN